MLLLSRLIAALMALYRKCVLSLAIPTEAFSFSGPSAFGTPELNAHQNVFFLSMSEAVMVYKLIALLQQTQDVYLL